MSKKKEYKKAQQEVFDAKLFYVKVLKRYGISLLIATPIIIAINFLLSYLIPGYKGPIMYAVIFTLLLLTMFIALVVFNNIDKRREERPVDKEKERDPFAD